MQTPRDGSDYINANLLTSAQGDDPAWAFIATQGPVKATIADFWQMVHEQQCDTVRTGVHERLCAGGDC